MEVFKGGFKKGVYGHEWDDVCGNVRDLVISC